MIPLTSKFEDKIPFLMRKIVSLDQDNVDSLDDGNIDIELQNKIRNCFVKLENTLTKKNLTLFKVFVAYDGDKSGSISVGEFGKIMKRLDASFTEDEIETIFDLIDEDRSKTIEFIELNSYYSKINGIP